MTRARELAKLANETVWTIDTTNTRVGIGSTIPSSSLNVGLGVTIDGKLIKYSFSIHII